MISAVREFGSTIIITGLPAGLFACTNKELVNGSRLGGRSCSGLYLFARIPLAACRQTPTLFAVCIAAVEDDCLISCSIKSSACDVGGTVRPSKPDSHPGASAVLCSCPLI